ncbi:MAG: hypothetical protein L0191_08220 [Acidobacteria bacterium]|nr:hypothetical protein [Acidobacteriota bacterium]
MLASYEGEGYCRVVEHLTLEAAAAIEDAPVPHTLALAAGQSLTEVEAKTDEGPLPIQLVSDGPLTELAVLARARPAGSRLEYTLSYAVKGVSQDPYRCPLAVVLATPRDPNGVVSIVLRLPPGRKPTAAPFPNLNPRSEELVAQLGALPAFLRVPFGDPGVRSLLNPHAFDLTILALLGVSTAVWWKMRARLGPRDPGEPRESGTSSE